MPQTNPPITIDLKTEPIEIGFNRATGDLSPGQPMRVGIPFARGRLQALDALCLEDNRKNLLPLQVTELARWPDGSLKHILADWGVPENVSDVTRFQIKMMDAETPPNVDSPVNVQRDGTTVHISTAGFTWEFGPTKPLWGASDQNTVLVNLIAKTVADEDLHAANISVEVLHEGPLRAVVRTTGQLYAGHQSTPLFVIAESHFFAGSRLRKLTLTLRNSNRAEHPGGIWELGDSGSVALSDVSLELTTLRPIEKYSCSIDDRSEPIECGDAVSLFQASSGGENWQSENHVGSNGKVGLAFRGYQLRSQNIESDGNRANPIMTAGDVQEGNFLGLYVEQLWQNFPKTISSTPHGIRVGLFPAEARYDHELQGGEQKTHSLWVTDGGPEDLRLLNAIRVQRPLQLDPQYVASTQTVRFLTPLGPEENVDYRSLVECAVEGESSFFVKREQIDEYGWRDFGDVYGDHEAAFHDGPTPLVSHWNNQYDLIFGLGVRFLRSGDRRWFDMMQSMVSHVIDIDLYHTDQDKAAYNHGLFWHTVHYIDARKANHRSYPSGTVGGGPCSEHAYARGFQLYYYLTGDQAAHDAVVELANWVLAMEDGSKTPFRWLASGPTGLSSASGNPDYNGPGRGPGNASETLMTAFELTGRRIYLDRVEELMYRVVHPEDDQDALNLLDAETRWYYNLYLQALGRYLEIKLDLGETDVAYGYGRSTLLHYARWMAKNEYPYLDKPEKLEFPTETWAAQDMRKSEVFHFASRHADGPERERFNERAAFFYDYSVSKLQELPSRHYCRPIALLLGSGFSYDWFRRHDTENPTLVGESHRFPRKPRFVPQKRKAVMRAKTIVASSLAIIGLVVIVFGCIRWLLK